MARLLIFEDEADIAELYRLELEDRGHEVLGIHTDPLDLLEPKEGLSLVLSPDLILLDERLGSVSGVKYLGKLRRAFPGARILVVSADPDALERGLAGGADGVARKPLLLKRLVQDIERVLARPTA